MTMGFVAVCVKYNGNSSHIILNQISFLLANSFGTGIWSFEKPNYISSTHLKRKIHFQFFANIFQADFWMMEVIIATHTNMYNWLVSCDDMCLSSMLFPLIHQFNPPKYGHLIHCLAGSAAIIWLGKSLMAAQKVSCK